MRTERKLLDRLIGLALVAPLCVALFVHGSTKVVTEKGIRLTKCEVDANKATLEWSAEDSRIKPGATFKVQKSADGKSWQTVATTTSTNAVVNGFTVDKDTLWRIAVDVN